MPFIVCYAGEGIIRELGIRPDEFVDAADAALMSSSAPSLNATAIEGVRQNLVGDMDTKLCYFPPNRCVLWQSFQLIVHRSASSTCCCLTPPPAAQESRQRRLC